MVVLLLVIDISAAVCTLRLLMRPGIDSSPPPSPPLTLRRLMGAIAVSALAFAYLPPILSVALTVTVFGILVLSRMRLPLVTSGGGVWRWLPWVLWSLALMACPVAITVVGTTHGVPHETYINSAFFPGPLPWIHRVVDGLCFAHLGISVVASVAVVVLTRGGYRWLAWAAILRTACLPCSWACARSIHSMWPVSRCARRANARIFSGCKSRPATGRSSR